MQCMVRYDRITALRSAKLAAEAEVRGLRAQLGALARQHADVFAGRHPDRAQASDAVSGDDDNVSMLAMKRTLSMPTVGGATDMEMQPSAPAPRPAAISVAGTHNGAAALENGYQGLLGSTPSVASVVSGSRMDTIPVAGDMAGPSRGGSSQSLSLSPPPPLNSVNGGRVSMSPLNEISPSRLTGAVKSWAQPVMHSDAAAARLPLLCLYSWRRLGTPVVEACDGPVDITELWESNRSVVLAEPVR